MNGDRGKAAVIGALMTDPSSALNHELKAIGVQEAWARIMHGHPSVPEQLRRRLHAIDLPAFMARGERVGARVIIPGDADWPVQLRGLQAQEPWALWVRGPGLDALASERSVAIVGARSSSRYGDRVASEFAADIARFGLPVVSGGAVGIDAAAHRGALAVDGVTATVLGCGIDVPYPPQNSALFERIADRGVLLSEAAPGAHPTKPSFLVRNRLIAALSYGTLVVEARLRSGSISTYCHARSLCRVLMAVPGPVTAPESGGTNALLQDDACLVTSAADVLALVAPLGSAVGRVADPGATEWDALSEHERAVHEALPARGPITVDALLGRVPSGLGMAQVYGALALLAGRGIVAEETSGAWRRVRSLRGADT